MYAKGNAQHNIDRMFLLREPWIHTPLPQTCNLSDIDANGGNM